MGIHIILEYLGVFDDRPMPIFFAAASQFLCEKRHRHPISQPLSVPLRSS